MQIMLPLPKDESSVPARSSRGPFLLIFQGNKCPLTATLVKGELRVRAANKNICTVDNGFALDQTLHFRHILVKQDEAGFCICAEQREKKKFNENKT
ncbi:MAG: hypothetical protein F8N37_10810 [Telmatospirillum sp.]|nr:hypothetical protein [Telmatospirillum sp.]